MRVQVIDQDGRTLLESDDPSLVRAAGQTMAVYAQRACLDAGDADGAVRYGNIYQVITEMTV